jgi:ABC-type lipoprotein release transport system permease subunit
MNMLRIAWRNIWRNGARTAITGAAIALNTAILVVTIGLTQGMLQTTVDNLTSMAVGEAQVHAPGYRSKRSLHDSIPQPNAVLEAAARSGVDAVARSYGAGLASVGAKSSGALFWGVDPARERQAFDLARQVRSGSFLSDQRPALAPDQPESGSVREVVLGRKLANALQAQVGSELIAVVQAADGSIGNDLFVVRGILKTVSSDIDRSAAILHHADFAELFVSSGRVHQIALRSHGRLSSAQVVAAVRPAAPELEVLTWQQLAPGPAQMVEMFAAVMMIFGLIFGMAAGTSVMNSMLMSTFDRIREFGVLKALGATPLRIVRDVACEAWVLALLFSALGAGLGALANLYLRVHGLNLATGDDLLLSGVEFDPVWRATPTVEGVIGSILLMWVISVVAALYPALKAARLDPAVAMTEP